MALINCPECATEVSSAAPSCPKCGFPIASSRKKQGQAEDAPVLRDGGPVLRGMLGDDASPDFPAASELGKQAEPQATPEARATESRQMSFLLAVGIFWLPLIFAWFTLRKGYSTKARAISFAWLALFVVGMVGQEMEKDANRDAATREAFEEQNRAALVAPACDAHRDAVVDALPVGARLVDMSCEEHGWVKVQVLAPPSTHENRAKHILTNTVRRMAENDYSPRTRDLTILLFSLALEKTVTGETRSVIDSAATYYPTVDEVRITE